MLGVWARVVRSEVRAGSSLEEGRSGTRERMGWIVVVVESELCCEEEGGEFAGVRRCDRCFSAAFLYKDGFERGFGPALEDGQAIWYPPAPSASDGWMSKLSADTPSWILAKYEVNSAERNRW